MQTRRGTFLVRESETTKGKKNRHLHHLKGSRLPVSVYNDVLNLCGKGQKALNLQSASTLTSIISRSDKEPSQLLLICVLTYNGKKLRIAE